jgi:hypothetical protein
VQNEYIEADISVIGDGCFSGIIEAGEADRSQ